MTKDEALSAKHEGATTVALKLALEALESIMLERGSIYDRALTAIREALAQPEHSPNCALLKIPSKDCDCQDQQESVAITITGKLGNIYSFTGDYSLKKGDKVYTTPPQQEPVIDKSAAVRIATSLGWEPKRKPLTYEQRQYVVGMWKGGNWTAGDIIDAVEAAHGIKE